MRALGVGRHVVWRVCAGRDGSIYSRGPRLEHRRMWSGNRGLGDGGGHGSVVGCERIDEKERRRVLGGPSRYTKGMKSGGC